MLIVDGARIPGTERVREEISFKPGMPNTRRQARPPRGLGIHWTGGENSWKTTRRVLENRELSVNFIEDEEIVQTADVMTRCAHIGTPGNDFAGLEVKCRGYARKEDLAAAKLRDPSLRDRDELDWSSDRDLYADKIDGDLVRMAGFNTKQLENVLWLAETLAGVLKFPRAIPWRTVSNPAEADALPFPNSHKLLVKGPDGLLYLPAFNRDPRKGSTSRAATHRGALGHFHIHETKHDPGTQIFYLLWSEGWNPAALKIPGVIIL